MEFTFECCDLNVVICSFGLLSFWWPKHQILRADWGEFFKLKVDGNIHIWTFECCDTRSVWWQLRLHLILRHLPPPSTHTQLTKTFEISYHDTMILYESTHNSPNQSTHTQLTYYLYSDFHHGTVQVHPHSINSNFWNPTIAAFHFDLDFHHHGIASHTVLPIWALPKTFCW